MDEPRPPAPGDATTVGGDGEVEAPPVGGSLGRFVVTGIVGAGGMGVVLRGYDPVLDRKVAIKLLHASLGRDDDDALLVAEAQAMAQIAHPNVVAVYDVGVAGGRTFVAMELIDGVSLRTWLDERPRGWRAIVAAYASAGHGLAAVHAAGQVHRDFKPGNVLVGKDGRVRVVDFGLARGTALAPAGLAARAGTPRYMSPEQLAGAPLDARSDQFAYCVALYEALYGTSPFAGDDRETIAAAIATTAVRPPRGRRVPAAIGAALMRGLARDPAARWPDLPALVARLEHVPIARRRRRILAIATPLVAAAAALAILRPGSTSAPACASAAPRLRGVWDDDARRAIATSFAATRSAYAGDAAARASATLDAYAQQWVELGLEVCRATRVERRQSDALMDLRFACLEERRAALAGLTAVWARPVDITTVGKAVDAARALPALADCSDARWLGERVPPPTDPVLVARIDATRAGVGEIRALMSGDRWSEASALLDRHQPEAAAIGWAPLVADAAILRGRVRAHLGDAEAGAAILDAIAQAGTARDDRLAAEGMITLTGYLARIQQDFKQARLVARLADGVVERAGGNDVLRGKVALVHGMTEQSAGDLAASRGYLERARALLTAALGAGDSFTSDATQSLGRALSTLGDPAAGRALLEDDLRVRAAALGNEAPALSSTLGNLGAVLDDASAYEAAIAAYRRALSLTESSPGRDGSGVANMLSNLAISEGNAGRFDDAEAHLARALAITTAQFGPDHLQLAQRLVAQGTMRIAAGRLDDALPPLRRALELQIRDDGADHAEVGGTLIHIADAESARGNAAVAADAYDRAYQINLRAQGPEAQATLLAGLAAASERCTGAGTAAAAARIAELVATLDRVQTPEQTLRAAAHQRYGLCLLEASRGRAALGAFDRARELLRAVDGRGVDLAEVDLYRARAQWATGARADAITTAEGALTALAALTGPRIERDRGAVRTWLAAHR